MYSRPASSLLYSTKLVGTPEHNERSIENFDHSSLVAGCRSRFDKGWTKRKRAHERPVGPAGM